MTKFHVATRRAPTFERVVDRLFFKYLTKRSSKHVIKRGHHIAIFADDWIGKSIIANGIYSYQEIEDIFYFCDIFDLEVGESTILDIGANIGNHTIQFSRKFKAVHSFEANPRVLHLLLANTFSLNNVTIHQHGLGHEACALELFEDPSNFGASSISGNDLQTKPLNIIVKPLDALSDDIPNIDVIKMDVEGYELNVLQGAQGILDTHRPLIFFEQLHDEFGAPANETAAIDFLRSMNYAVITSTAKNNGNRVWSILKSLRYLFSQSTEDREFTITTKIIPNNYDSLIAVPLELVSSQLKQRVS